ncbi:hypothetical protein E4P40_14970 [Blastococcus sp. CT_GayMR20]|uniref:hypothetical protein n=1 Tax=Blastococcus sp. CT_GayMR20 TaxID=2559609 RepID=UPI0010735506|nr:hypothetical protein [Blastococcus sp. CT_GayMR20]TFV82983.1 hypothetical protein E4P40_14970 [Blastococcus sp. CT_GayMR20]
MILAAGLMVLLGLGLFVAGVLTGVTAFYWGCVAACVVAAVLLFLARRTMGPGRTPAAGRGKDATPASAERTTPGAAATEMPATWEPSAVPDAAGDLPDPPVEEVEVTDLLLVVDLTDEVYVLDEHPRYHLAGCVHLRGHTPVPLPIDEARTDGFTPCAVCAPDRNLAERVRARKAAGS